MTQELKTAIQLVSQYEQMPFLFVQSQIENPKSLVEYIANQAQGRFGDKSVDVSATKAYEMTSRMFGKQLTEACVKAYPNE